jgi:hypothetical protein
MEMEENKVLNVNPNKCYFIATYPDGTIVKGKNLFDTGWNQITNGLSKLDFVLSTEQTIEIQKSKAYLFSVEYGIDKNKDKIFHSAIVKCLTEKDVLVYRIILRQDSISKLRIGDVVFAREEIPEEFDVLWKFAG